MKIILFWLSMLMLNVVVPATSRIFKVLLSIDLIGFVLTVVYAFNSL